jgi:hypothetical protein
MAHCELHDGIELLLDLTKQHGIVLVNHEYIHDSRCNFLATTHEHSTGNKRERAGYGR